MPNYDASCAMICTVSAPAWCPKLRSCPRSFAQRPLPSMMIATCCGIRLKSSSSLFSIFLYLHLLSWLLFSFYTLYIRETETIRLLHFGRHQLVEMAAPNCICASVTAEDYPDIGSIYYNGIGGGYFCHIFV